MPELKTAETNVVEDSHADVATNEVVFEDTKDTEEVTTETKVDEVKPAQSSEQNAENARRRREAERQKELKEAKEQAIIETLKGVNPYTNEEMKDSADVEEYLTMRDIEAKGGDPLADFSKFQKAKLRESESKKVEEDKQAEWFKKDREEFAKKHPEANLDTLVQDKSFQTFANGKVGTMPMSEIYEDFLEMTSEYEKKAKQMVKQMVANQKATPGSLASTNANDGFFTREQVEKMSPKEVSQHYDKIRESMTRWKN